MAKFLSNEWFDLVANLNNQSTELNLPPTLQALIVNIKIVPDVAEFHLKEGKIWQGAVANAKSTILVDNDTLMSLITSKDTSLAIGAFMTGKIRVEGDMSALLSLQSAKPSQEQKALYKEILAMTEF